MSEIPKQTGLDIQVLKTRADDIKVNTLKWVEIFSKNQKIRPFIPHIVLAVVLSLIISLGFIFNIRVIAYFTGSILGMAFDPMCLLSSFIIGFMFLNYKNLILVGAIISILVSFLIGMSVENWRKKIGLPPATLEIYVIRILCILILAHVFNFFRVYFFKNLNILTLVNTKEM